MIINIRKDDTNTPLVLAVVLSISGVVVTIVVGFTIWSLKRSRKKAQMEFFEVDQEFLVPLPPGYQYRLQNVDAIASPDPARGVSPIERWFVRRRRGDEYRDPVVVDSVLVAYGGEWPICVRTYPRSHPLYDETQRGVVVTRMPPIPLAELPRLPDAEFARPVDVRPIVTPESTVSTEEGPLSPANTAVQSGSATANGARTVLPCGRRKNTTRPVVHLGARPDDSTFIGTKTAAGHVALISKGNIDHDLDEMCVVCQEKVVDKPEEQEEEEPVVTLPCLHSFHECCIARWMICYNPRCPVCSKVYIIRNGKKRERTVRKW